MIRVFLLSGGSQLLFLSAALLKNKELEKDKEFKDILLFTSKDVDEKRISSSNVIAHKVWSWHDVIWFDDLGYHSAANKKNLLKERFQDVTQLWVCMPYGELELDMSTTFSSAKIIYFDDGLGSYVMPNTLKEYFEKPSFLKKKWSLYIKRTANALGDVFKMNGIGLPSLSYHRRYMLFSEYFQNSTLPPRHVIVDWSLLEEQLLKCQIDINPELNLKDQRACLILGQYFSLFGYLDRDEELQHYVKLCENLESKGYEILWKEHPKNTRPFYDDLSKQFGSIRNLNDYYDPSLPVEIIACNLDIDLYVASTSTSLIILNKVFNFNINCSAPVMEKYMVGADKFVANLLIDKLDDNQLLKQL